MGTTATKDKKVPRDLAILRTMDKISMGLSRNGVLKSVSESCGVHVRTAQGYYAEAQSRLAELGEHFHQAQIAEILGKLRELYDAAFATGNYEFCLEILQNQAALSGLSLRDGAQNFTAIMAEVSRTGGNGDAAGDVHATIKMFMADTGARKAFLKQIGEKVPTSSDNDDKSKIIEGTCTEIDDNCDPG